jgi:hypothetical protein
MNGSCIMCTICRKTFSTPAPRMRPYALSAKTVPRKKKRTFLANFGGATYPAYRLPNMPRYTSPSVTKKNTGSAAPGTPLHSLMVPYHATAAGHRYVSQ